MPRRDAHLRVVRKPVCALRTAQDADLLARTGLDEVTLRRVRQAFTRAWSRLPAQPRTELIVGGASARLRWANAVIGPALRPDGWALWLGFLDHNEDALRQMEYGDYPMAPYIITRYSTLLGITVDWLRYGRDPEPDERGSWLEFGTID